MLSSAQLVTALALLPAAAVAAEWTIDDSCSDLISYGLGVADATHAVAGTSSSAGAEPAFYNGSWTFTHGSPSGAIMDIASLPNNEVAVYSTFGGPYLSSDQGESWTHVAGAVNPAQSVQAFNGDSFGITGEFSTQELRYFGGVIMSTDKGATWNSYEIDGAQYARYGDFPSATTWYVTEGGWPTGAGAEAFAHAAPNLEEGYELSANIRVGKQDNSNKKASTGYTANIWKTSDGGKTFEKVFSSAATDSFYFNAISCGSETSCVAVAEGEVPDTKIIIPQSFAYHTENGGKTWKKVFDGGDAYKSLMGVKMVNELEGWMVPSGMKENSTTVAVTDFMYTSNGGATWELNQTLEDCISSYIDAADGLVMATCIGFGPSSETRIAVYG
mmetsp:Transcript_110234/g.321022  ORF Transcript_110234/g.321022 Transcript_110234/m.321022 type:complete len:387 (-) Transcript_110234:119-1279(-)